MITTTSFQTESHPIAGERSIMSELNLLLTGKQNEAEPVPHHGDGSVDTALDSFNSQIWLNQNFRYRILKAIERIEFNHPAESQRLNKMVNEHTEFVIQLAAESMKRIVDIHYSAAPSLCKEFGALNSINFEPETETIKTKTYSYWINEWTNQTNENAWFK